MVEQFYGSEGSLAFIIPFSFTTDGQKDSNVCTKLFSKIRPEDDRDQYEYYKDELIAIISKSFPNARNRFCGATVQNTSNEETHSCYYLDRDTYKGRNLCHCFSVCRKFHDDRSQDIPRIEIYLGSYHVHYELQNAEKFFDFYIDALLLLTNETGGEGGYLLFNTSLASVKENCIETQTVNRLDAFIFLKHLFYKSRLKCSIEEEQSISIQQWADEYLKTLLSVLEIKSKEKVFFKYTMMELNNITGNSLSLSDIDTFLDKYRNQVYGLMVSDEGWRYMPKDVLKSTFSTNHWSSRSGSVAFFLGHSSLIINQYNEAAVKCENQAKSYHAFSREWFEIYVQSSEYGFYKDYARIRPCVPGVSSLILYAFLKAIYKEMVLEKVKEMTEGSSITDEEKYKRLAFALQQHSMSLDAIKNIEDCIYSQFGIPAELNALRESYKREANNVQNKKIMNLTYITAIISMSALVIAVLAIGVEDGHSLFSLGMYWTIGVLVAAIIIPIATCIIVQRNLLDKRK